MILARKYTDVNVFFKYASIYIYVWFNIDTRLGARHFQKFKRNITVTNSQQLAYTDVMLVQVDLKK